jgi:hypothetical protein
VSPLAVQPTAPTDSPRGGDIHTEAEKGFQSIFKREQADRAGEVKKHLDTLQQNCMCTPLEVSYKCEIWIPSFDMNWKRYGTTRVASVPSFKLILNETWRRSWRNWQLLFENTRPPTKIKVCMCFIATRKNLGFYISVVLSFQAKRPKRGVRRAYESAAPIFHRGERDVANRKVTEY